MSSKLPFVTIGISFYNSESTLLDAIRSVFLQTHKNWELILIDDGSTDNSFEVAKTIDDPRVKVYSDGKNKKLAARLNQIIKLSKYDFIVRMDADDLMAPDRIEKQLNILVNNSDIDLVSTGVLSLTDNNIPVGVRNVEKEHDLNPENVLYLQSGIIHASIVARKSWFLRNPYTEDYPLAEDSALWVSAYGRSDLNIFFLRESLYFYREDSSATKYKLLQAYKSDRRIVIKSDSSKYNYKLKVKLYILSIMKTLVVLILSKIGKLNILRDRRNKERLTEVEYDRYCLVLEEIKGFKLPVKYNNRV